MKGNARTSKITLIISVISIIISLVGITFAVMNLRLVVANGQATGSARILLWCITSIFFANTTIFIISRNRYENFSK